MPSLRTLLNSLEPPTIGNEENVFYVQDTNSYSQNGGRCCLFCVPEGYTRVTFEMWGAGGDGQGARCCERGGLGAIGGSYSIKTIDTTQGCCYRICAAGSGCEGCCCGRSTNGFPSYVYDFSAASTIACAPGGDGGNSDITRGGYAGYTCCWGRLGSEGLGDITMPGVGTTHWHNQYCCQDQWDMISGGISSSRITPDHCAGQTYRSGASLMSSCPSFPGGAGTAGRAVSDGRCFGQHGAAGLVKVTYS